MTGKRSKNAEMDDKNNIDDLNDNLDEIAPNLSNLRKEKPFALPGDYFDDLASKIQDKCAEADEISEIAPVLSGLSKYNPFAVPGGYFDELPAQIQERCIETRTTSLWERLAWLFKPRFVIPAAAAIIAVVIALVMLKGNGNDPVKQEMAQVTETTADSDTMETVTEEALLGMNDAEVLEALWSDPVTEVSEDTEEEHAYITANEEEIMNYLLDNNTDISAIVNEL